MMMMNTQNLLLFILLLLFLQTSECHDKCSYSSCGVIPNISFPFRLKNDPKHCGDPKYELVCRDNITTINLRYQKFHVKAINYQNFTIRLSHLSINNNHTFSLPTYSLYAYNFTSDYPYYTRDDYTKLDPYYTIYDYTKFNPYEVAWPINFMSCPHKLKNSSLFTEISERDAFFNASEHTYIKVGHMDASAVSEDKCGVYNILLTSWKFKDSNNVSVSEIHQSLLYGFELSWFRYPCSKCNPRSVCYISRENISPTCSEARTYTTAILIFVLAIVVVLGGISIPAKIIFGLTSLCGFMYFTGSKWNFGINEYDLWSILMYIVFMCGARLVIVFPCVMGILIYKFRRRHLSTYDTIERFLQSDNQLMPIRYSYSDIKRMTRGFRDKLGQGGYGSVYKGKLRSGHDVAVKLLGKPGGNDQDFMNEIATIGRIHHCNVVKLVGFCAQGSKRALIFDFMSNGSLEKYIFSHESKNSLSWQKKYEIAVGVARGIQYLHQGCDIQILHFDIKPHNVLLDDKFIPRISDFGLAKFCSTDKRTVTLTAARGTIGYVAPELINRGIGGVSYKADVYSFGMMLMEMVGLNRDSSGNNNASSSQYFPCWIYDYFEQGKDIEIGKTDDDDDDNEGTRIISRKMTIVGLWCIQISPDARPSMNKVVEMLEADVQRLQIPQRPSQPAPVALNVDQSWTTSYPTDSVSLLYHDTPRNVEIIVEMT